MEWDWSDTFKTAIIAALGWVGQRTVKKLKPAWVLLKKFINLAQTTDQISYTVSLLKNQQLALFHIDKDPIFITNLKGEVTYVNPAFLDLTGFENAEESYGFGYTSAIHPDSRAEHEKLRAELVLHPSPYHGYIKLRNKKTGKVILTVCRTKLVYNLKNELVETIGRIYIITE